MRVLIVDDEPVARRILREELQACERVEIAGEAEDGATALQFIENQHPDVVLLDLQMPVMGGFQIMSRLGGAHLPAVIIVTAYDEHAIQAFEAGAVDYLLKPVRQARLRQALERAKRLLGHPQELAKDIARIQSVIPPESSVRRSPKIVGKSGDEFFLLKVDEVLAFQADGDLTWILTHKRRYLATENLKSLQGKFHDSGFRRVHRSALVNVDAIRKLSIITSQRWMITLTNGQEFIVSKRQARNIRDVLHG